MPEVPEAPVAPVAEVLEYPVAEPLLHRLIPRMVGALPVPDARATARSPE